MNEFNLWCCFCDGPFEDAREGWLEAISDLTVQHEGEFSFTPHPALAEDIVTISEEDGRFWSDVVCVGRGLAWDNYVSPRGTVSDGFGTIAFADFSMNFDDVYTDSRLIIHPQCLSFLCRRIDVSPKQIWDSIHSSAYLDFKRMCLRIEFGSGSYGTWTEDPDDRYYDYCVRQFRPKKGEKRAHKYWKNLDSMKDLQWLLARPTVFPVVSSYSPSISFDTPPSSRTILDIPHLLDTILEGIIEQDISQTQLSKELESQNTFTPSSIVQITKTIFALLQVNKSLYIAILRDHQNLFLRLAWMHGWMLPFTPQDWNNWLNGTFHNGTMFKVKKDQDWRAYLLTFLRKEDVHVKNRWRFHKRATQFARGQSEVKGRERRWRFNVGELGLRPDVKPPQPWFWEKDKDDEED